MILERRRDGTLAPDRLHVQGAVTAVANFQKSNRDDKFGYFITGPDGAPWEHQDQLVLGAAWFVRPSAKLFTEYIRTEGYAPFNFISGGSVRDDRGAIIPDRTHSDRTAHSDVFMVGVNLAF